MFKDLVIRFVPEPILWAYRRSDYYHNKLVKKWESPKNAHLIKEKNIIELQKEFNYDFFIETGTLHGEMVYKLNSYFKNLITIELSMNLFRAAKRRLRNYSKIEFVQGDSGKVLPEILSRISNPCIFWLDAHNSYGNTAEGDKDTPIEEELNSILSHQLNHIILIDDVRFFGNPIYPDYPKLEKIKNIVASKKSDYNFEVYGDIIRIYKNN